MKISIIIPIYNKVKYIERLLCMIENQTFQDFECILIDDGSTDGSGDVCDQVCHRNCKFIVRHIPNGGVSHARNIGLDISTGKYITFIDADDEIPKDYLQNLYDCIRESGADIVIGGHSNIWDNNMEVVPVESPYESGLYHFTDIISDFAKIQSQSGLYGWCWSKLLSRELIGENCFTEELALAEDFDFYLKVYPNVDTVYFDDKPQYLYRLEAENCSVAKDDDDIDYLGQLRINIKYRLFLKRMNSWSGENKNIVEQRLCDYVYFTLFHSPLLCFESRFNELYTMVSSEKIYLKGDTLLKKILFLTLEQRYCKLAKIIMTMYRKVREIVRALR